MVEKEEILKKIREVYSDYEKESKNILLNPANIFLQHTLRNFADIYNADKEVPEYNRMIYKDWFVVENYVRNLLGLYTSRKVDYGENKDVHVEKIIIPKKNNFIKIEEEAEEVIIQITSQKN